jgi:cytochrome c1
MVGHKIARFILFSCSPACRLWPIAKDEANCAMRRSTAHLAWLPLAMLAGCGGPDGDLGDARTGQVIITQQACGACHRIPGISGAEGTAGPALDHFASQPKIAGVLPNTPAALEQFLLAPETVVKDGAMPNMALSQTQARQIAAYLYTLK